MINLNYKSEFRQAKNYIMKKLMPLLDKNTKPSKQNPQLHKSFLKQSKSEVFLVRRHKKSTSPDTKKIELSKNDQRITIYTDVTGFIVEYSALGYGLKCDCFVAESVLRKNSKTLKLQSVAARQKQTKKKVKLEITLSKHHITTIKNGVQHIFSIPQDSKQSYLKVVLAENWQVQQFTIPNKKTKISDIQSLNASQKDMDQIYPLKNIIEADELRKNKLVKSDSKIKISWGNTEKDIGEDSILEGNKSEILSFASEKIIGEMNRSAINVSQTSKQIPSTAFLRKSFNECDQTRDSQEEHIVEEKHLEKREKHPPQLKLNKTLSIDLTQWNYTPIIKESIMSPTRQSNFQHRILGERFFK